MEGAYNKVLAARPSMASPYYLPLLDRLSNTVRDEIASCSEAAYASLPVGDAVKMLRLEHEGELKQYAAARGWVIENGRVVFPPSSRSGAGAGTGGDGDVEMNGDVKNTGALVGGASSAFEVIEHCLGYALQLERIV